MANEFHFNRDGDQVTFTGCSSNVEWPLEGILGQQVNFPVRLTFATILLHARLRGDPVVAGWARRSILIVEKGGLELASRVV